MVQLLRQVELLLAGTVSPWSPSLDAALQWQEAPGKYGHTASQSPREDLLHDIENLNLDRYIKRITFRQDTTKVLLTFDVIDGVITNVVVRETNVADRKLFGALERSLRDNAIIESNMSVTNCRLPFRVDLTLSLSLLICGSIQEIEWEHSSRGQQHKKGR